MRLRSTLIDPLESAGLGCTTESKQKARSQSGKLRSGAAPRKGRARPALYPIGLLALMRRLTNRRGCAPRGRQVAVRRVRVASATAVATIATAAAMET